MGNQFVAETPQDRERRLALEKAIPAQTQPVVDSAPIDIKQFLNVYEFETTLIGSGQVVKFKPVTTGQMKKLLVYEQADSSQEIEKALDELLSSCVISPDFDINDLYLQDRFQLLLDIRSKTKGDTYSFQWKCPVCELRQPTTISIAVLNRKPTKEMTSLLDINEHMKAEIAFPTRGMQAEASELVSGLKLANDNERLYETGLYTYALCMSEFHTPVGKTTPNLQDKLGVLNGTGTILVESIQKWMTDNDFGVEFSVDVGCIGHDCDFVHNMDIPYSDFFV